LVSRAPLANLEAYKRRMGWNVPWYSSAENDFNDDFGLTTDEGETFGLSAFLRDGENVFHTYFTTDRASKQLTATLRCSIGPFSPSGGMGGLAGRLAPVSTLRVVAPPRRI